MQVKEKSKSDVEIQMYQVAPRLLLSAGNAQAGIPVPALRGAEGDSIRELPAPFGPVVIVFG